jgi:hypothetical protein
MRRAALTVCTAVLVIAACGGGSGASRAVEGFVASMADSAYGQAWDLLTPSTQAQYDSTMAVLRRFGWPESRESLTDMVGEVTEAQFDTMTGRGLFTLSSAAHPESRDLSDAIESVTHPDSGVAVVVLNTNNGPQEIVVRRIEGKWLLDLTELRPPAERGSNGADQS